MNSKPKPWEEYPLEYAAARFIDIFREVFHYDWAHTYGCLKGIDTFVDESGTFIAPGKDNWDEERNKEADDWGRRAGLLDSYRELSEMLMARGFHPDQIDPDELEASSM